MHNSLVHGGSAEPQRRSLRSAQLRASAARRLRAAARATYFATKPGFVYAVIFLALKASVLKVSAYEPDTVAYKPAADQSLASSLFESRLAQVLVAVAALAAVLLFAYFYWRDWQAETRYKALLPNKGPEGRELFETPTPIRPPLIRAARAGSSAYSAAGSPKKPTGGPSDKRGLKHPRGTTFRAAPPPGVLIVSGDREDVYVNGKLLGATPARLSLAAGRHVIEVRKPGHAFYRRQVQINEGQELTMRPVLIAKRKS